MSFWSDFTGGSQRRDIRNAFTAERRGNDAARETTLGYAGNAKNYLEPYQRSGNAAYGQYTAAIGADGPEAQQSYWNNYQADPQRGYDENRAVDAVNRSMSSRGMSRSGFGALAGARAGMDAGRNYTMDRLNRLQGLGQQGYGTANQLANIDLSTGQQLSALDVAKGQAEAGMNMGLAGSRNILTNNLMEIGGMIISAATGMPVGMGSGGGSSSGGGGSSSGGGGIAPGGHGDWRTYRGPNSNWT